MKIEVQRKVNINIDELWKVVGNFFKTPGKGIVIEQVQSKDDPGGKNIRSISFGRIKVTEELVEITDNYSFTYSILKGSPTKYYTGKCQLSTEGDETLIIWSGNFIPTIPLIGWLMKIISKRNINMYINAATKPLLK